MKRFVLLIEEFSMKPSNTKKSKERQLTRRLGLVRTTIRELTPDQLKNIGGGSDSTDDHLGDWPSCHIMYTL